MMTMQFFLTFFTKAYVVGTHLNCIDLYTGCNLKTTEFLDCALIGVCAVIRSNTVFYFRHYKTTLSALVAQLGARLNGDEIVQPIPGQHHSRGDRSVNILYSHSVRSTDSRRAVVNFCLED